MQLRMYILYVCINNLPPPTAKLFPPIALLGLLRVLVVIVLAVVIALVVVGAVVVIVSVANAVVF